MPSSTDRAGEPTRSHDAPSPSAAAALDDATVLVTGGAGFIGSRLVDALAPVADVRVLDSGAACDPDRWDDVAFLAGDVTAPADLDAATAGVDHVFHLAACASVPETLDRPTRSLDVNATGTAAVLDRARREDARVVFASSSAVYGEPESTPVAEDDPLEPISPYGVGKLAADQYVTRYADWYDVPTVALRFFNVYGPGQSSGVIPTFLSRVGAGEPLVVHGDGDQTRDFVHVDDVVRALLAAATTDATGEAYNVGTGDATSVRELAGLVQRAVDGEVDVVHGEPRPADVDHSCADVRKARERLGFQARVGLREGVEALLAATE